MLWADTSLQWFPCQKTHHLILMMRKHQTNPNRDILQNDWLVLFQCVKVMKTQERPRGCHWQQAQEKQGLNAGWRPEPDPALQEGLLEEKRLNLNEVYGLINSTVPTSVSRFWRVCYDCVRREHQGRSGEEYMEAELRGLPGRLCRTPQINEKNTHNSLVKNWQKTWIGISQKRKHIQPVSLGNVN